MYSLFKSAVPIRDPGLEQRPGGRLVAFGFKSNGHLWLHVVEPIMCSQSKKNKRRNLGPLDFESNGHKFLPGCCSNPGGLWIQIQRPPVVARGGAHHVQPTQKKIKEGIWGRWTLNPTATNFFPDAVPIRVPDAVPIRVGGSSKADVRKKKKIVTNALNAAKAAMEEGILPGGGGISLLHASKELDELEITNSSQKIGVQIIQNALKMPVHAIASSAGVAGSFVGKLLAQENHDLACDATTEGEYVDMIDSGIVEPLKVISTAFLEAARSCASVTELEGSSSSGRKSITRKVIL
ncbi:hypothetical protein KPL71_012472 [Citrus sinensis]|uniref:Uncharacterized protein n=1 Tax=Citrus sinensis TaxID=2711 RepID=A0ACB8LBG4_CITSI|nr:hypothetical protein KPL71_012472 [Citrus sinensis]